MHTYACVQKATNCVCVVCKPNKPRLLLSYEYKPHACKSPANNTITMLLYERKLHTCVMKANQQQGEAFILHTCNLRAKQPDALLRSNCLCAPCVQHCVTVLHSFCGHFKSAACMQLQTAYKLHSIFS